MEILFGRKFQKRFKSLDQRVKKSFEKRLKIFTHDPRAPLLNIHPLSGEFSGCYSINVTGDYRAIFELRQDDTVVVFILIGTHHELYGK